MLRERRKSQNQNSICPIFLRLRFGETILIFQSAANRPPIGCNRLQSATTADRKRKVISFLEEYQQAKVLDLVNIIGLSEGRVRDMLREMVSDGTIEKVGKNRYAYYVLKQ